MTNIASWQLHNLLEEARIGGHALSLPGVSFSKGDYSCMNLSHAQLPESCWEGSPMQETDFRFTDLTGAHFKHCDLSGVKTLGSGYTSLVFAYCDLTSAQCPSSDFTWSEFIACPAARIQLDSSTLCHTRWTECDLACASMREIEAQGATFTHCLLTTSLREADLTETAFVSCELHEADLSGTNLTCAVFTDSSLKGANLYGAILEDAHFDSVEQLRKASLSREIRQAMYHLFSFIGQKDCYRYAGVLQEKFKGMLPETTLLDVLGYSLEREEDEALPTDDYETAVRKDSRRKMKQVAQNFCSGTIQHEPHEEGNPVAEIILEMLDEYLSQ